MKSKFTIKSYFVIILILTFGFLAYYVIPAFFGNPYYDEKLFPKIFVPSILTFSFIYLLFGELRTKMIIVEIGKNEIIIKRFFGLVSKTFRISELNGWKYSHLSSRGGTYEYLYLIKDQKKVIKISQFYHKNYFRLKNEIQAKFKYLGYEKFSYIDELKEIFS